jgi:glycosyltransferase involved in cell wall biosynthesis
VPVLVAVVQIPPPVNGLTTVSSSIVERFRSLGVRVEVVRLAPVWNGGAFRRLHRVLALAGVYLRVFRLALCHRISAPAFYITISGGIGQYLEFPLILLARLLFRRVYLHHHSFAYINSPSLITRLLLAAAGPDAVHICLGMTMANGLKSRYAISNCRVISNALFVKDDATIREAIGALSGRPLRMSFLSNIDIRKGVLVFIDCIEALRNRGVSCEAVIAGPFADEATKRAVEERALRLPDLKLLGPVYGEKKAAFLRNTDLMLFPTSYANEAEPLVILEALAHGTPVLSTARGCIPDVLGEELGQLVLPLESFLPDSIDTITGLLADETLLPRLSAQCRRRFVSMVKLADEEFNLLARELST